VLHSSRSGVAVKTSTSVPPTLRFGVFELDRRSGELRKKGIKVRLQGQPIDILVMLLERPGEVISREELQKKLWPADTFVDFEQGLNNAMKRLRAALEDDAESPHFIETLPRHGYRFIGSVNGIAQAPIAEAKAAHRLRAVIWVPAFGVLVVIAVAALLVGLNVRGWRDRIFMRAPKPQAVAVLPLANLSGDPEQEYFADGMTEALITELGKISSPRVISRQSIMQYKGSKKPLQEIARELNVDAILEGSVQRSGDRVHVVVRLDRVSPESQVWASEYNRSVRDVLGLQDEIARAVTDEIQTKLTPQERARLASTRFVDPEAYDDYLRGRFFLYKSVALESERDLQTALGYFKQATEKDPGYALAYAGLADANVILGHPSYGGRSPKETRPKARAAAARALELDPLLAEAHVSLAQTIYLYDWSEAEKEYRRALQLNPNSADAHYQYGGYLANLGRNDEAMAQLNYAIELDPLSLMYRGTVGWFAYMSRQYDLAIRQFESMGDDFGLAYSYQEKKMYPEAIAAIQRHAQRHSRTMVHVASLAYIYGLVGRRREALKLLEELRETARHRYVSPSLFVYAYMGLGEKNKALRWLERAYEDRDEWMQATKVWPALDPLRSEPRFQALLRRMNFPQ
jgi:TolB-like protein/DNA-binding winged helix-turn-helix (wHTH) protein